MTRWRNAERERIHYNGAEYERKDLLWTQRSFIQPQVMVEDRYLFDPVANKYTVNRYLDDLEKRYGGIDSVLLWPVYPNIGIDNRNQHDLLRDMPGGIEGVRAMIGDFHRRGVRVLFPVMPWDTGTRREGQTLAEAAARLMKEIGADGINGDTMNGLGREFRQAADALGHPLALEPEIELKDPAMVLWNNLSWGYWKYQKVPVVSRYKWVEPRHMVNVCERWARDRTDGLQSAFFNGVGYESWENVWGIWNQLTPRDAEALRRIATIERAVADLLVSADWEPHVRTVAARCPCEPLPRPGPLGLASGQPVRRGPCGRPARTAPQGGHTLLRPLVWGRAQARDRGRIGRAELHHRGPGIRRSAGSDFRTDARCRGQGLATHDGARTSPSQGSFRGMEGPPPEDGRDPPDPAGQPASRRHGAGSGRQVSLQGSGGRDRRG